MCFILGDLNFLLFAISIIIGSLTLAGIVSSLGAGVTLIIVGVFIFFFGLGHRGLFGDVFSRNAVGRRGVV